MENPNDNPMGAPETTTKTKSKTLTYVIVGLVVAGAIAAFFIFIYPWWNLKPTGPKLPLERPYGYGFHIDE
jgi:hypothetical protein